MKKKAAKIVNSAILGMDFRTVVVAGKAYVIKPPTIKNWQAQDTGFPILTRVKA